MGAGRFRSRYRDRGSSPAPRPHRENSRLPGGQFRANRPHALGLAACRPCPRVARHRGDAAVVYADKLGFTTLGRYPDYAIVARDDVQIHFWLTGDADIPKATSCRIDVAGVDQLYEEMSAAGVVHPNGPLTDQPWGLRSSRCSTRTGT